MNQRREGLKPVAFTALLLSSAILFGAQTATAQTGVSPDATASRPAKTPTGQTSEPNAAPPATTTQTTGEASHDATIRKMNEDEKQKVDTKGK